MTDTSKTAKIIKRWYHSPSHRLTVSVLLNNILGSRPWPCGITWRHRSRNHRTRRGHFPVGGQWWPCVYLARLWRLHNAKASFLTHPVRTGFCVGFLRFIITPKNQLAKEGWMDSIKLPLILPRKRTAGRRLSLRIRPSWLTYIPDTLILLKKLWNDQLWCCRESSVKPWSPLTKVIWHTAFHTFLVFLFFFCAFSTPAGLCYIL